MLLGRALDAAPAGGVLVAGVVVTGAVGVAAGAGVVVECVVLVEVCCVAPLLLWCLAGGALFPKGS